jgi:uncharacterized membrane protein
MPPWNALGLLLLVTEAVVRHDETGFYFLVAACIFWIAAATFTFIFMFPLNARLARTNPNSSPKESLLDFKRLWNSWIDRDAQAERIRYESRSASTGEVRAAR